jgi:hypothetical protein
LLNISLNWSNITSTVITYPYRSVIYSPPSQAINHIPSDCCQMSNLFSLMSKER